MRAELWRRLRLSLERFERAVAEGGVPVTRIVSRGRSIGSSAARGRRFHRSFASMPVEPAERWEGALPLAWRFRFGWVYGIADSVVVDGDEVAVIELKSGEVTRGAREQVSIYALLAMLNLARRPRAYVRTPSGLVEVGEWELPALEALERFARRGPVGLGRARIAR
ncbi:MAG: hypothetical protein QXQ60_06375 [Thermofilum sp.]